jgi:hypothetical protein
MVGYRSADSPVIYIYHRDHEHDRAYTENLVEVSVLVCPDTNFTDLALDLILDRKVEERLV